MPEYNFHIHGKPYSQDVWENDEYHDYLSGMYTNTYLKASSDESYLIIEILDNTVHYTYMRSKGVRDRKGREGSFFAMTVSLKGQYCSVIALYDLLDQIYNRFAKPSFFNQEDTNLQYKVIQLEDATIASACAVDQIKAAFDRNVMLLDLKNLDTSKDTIRSTETKVFSIMDVDSPEFISELKKYRIIVSISADSAIKRCGKVEAEFAGVANQNNLLTAQNNQLISQISSLKQENELLSSQLHSSASSAEKKYKDTIHRLKKEVENISVERDSLKRKIDEATSSIELIDKPVQKLTRLLAGRFPESDKKHFEEDLESSQKRHSKDTKKIRTSGLNNILLYIIIALCVAILCCVILSINTGNNTVVSPATYEGADSIASVTESPEDMDSDLYSESYEESEPEIAYDDLANCYLDLSGGEVKNRKFIVKGQKYILSVQKSINGKSSPAKVKEGLWSVIINEGESPINEDNSFVAPSKSGQNLLIKYKTKSGEEKIRVVTVE